MKEEPFKEESYEQRMQKLGHGNFEPNPVSIKNTIDQAEKWREEFVKACEEDWEPQREIYYSPANKDGFMKDINLMADFWFSKYSSYTKDLLQSVVEGLPLEKIHSLPDGVNSPHETEHDRGWNEYRRTLVSSLSDILKAIRENKGLN